LTLQTQPLAYSLAKYLRYWTWPKYFSDKQNGTV